MNEEDAENYGKRLNSRDRKTLRKQTESERESKTDVKDGLRYERLVMPNRDWSNRTLKQTVFDGCDLNHSVFQGCKLKDVEFSKCDLTYCNFDRSTLENCSFSWTNLTRSSFHWANAIQSQFKNSNLSRCSFVEAEIVGGSWSGSILNATVIVDSKLNKTDLSYTRLTNSKIHNSSLLGCPVLGLSAWRCDIQDTIQSELVITPREEPIICIDSLEFAQTLHLFLGNARIPRFIDASSKTLCLILGRFQEPHFATLRALKKSINESERISVLFDFNKPSNRNLTETVSLLAHLSFAVIADVSDPSSVPHELQALIPRLPSVKFIMLQDKSAATYSMIDDYKCYPWVSGPYRYESIEAAVSYTLSVLNNS